MKRRVAVLWLAGTILLGLCCTGCVEGQQDQTVEEVAVGFLKEFMAPVQQAELSEEEQEEQILAELSEEEKAWLGIWENETTDEFVMVHIDADAKYKDYPFVICGYDAYNKEYYPITRGEESIFTATTLVDTLTSYAPWKSGGSAEEEIETVYTLELKGKNMTVKDTQYMQNKGKANAQASSNAADYTLFTFESNYTYQGQDELEKHWKNYQEQLDHAS